MPSGFSNCHWKNDVFNRQSNSSRPHMIQKSAVEIDFRRSGRLVSPVQSRRSSFRGSAGGSEGLQP